jgi:hypothetical protein
LRQIGSICDGLERFAHMHTHFDGRLGDLIKQVADDLMAIGGHANGLPAFTRAQIIRAPVVVLPEPGGP